MKRKSILCLTLAAAMAAGSLVGCGSSSSTASTTGSTSASAASATQEAAASDTGIQPCEVTFWHAMTGEQETSLTELTDQFNSENQYGIKVTLVNQGSYNDLSTKLTANAAADTLPDLSQAYNSWLIPYLDKVVHLDDFVANDYDDYEDIVQSYRDETSQFGFINAMPFNKSTYVYFYNKTMFDELGLQAPQTWDDLLNIGKTFQEKKGMVSLGFDDMAGMLEATLRQNGCDYVNEEGAQFDNEAGQEALDFIMEMYNNGYARLVGEDNYFSGPFSNQLIPAYIGSSTGVSYITHDGWELGVAPLPGNTEKAANTAGTNIVMFSQDENQQKAAWEYLKFLTSTEATTKWAMDTGYLPVRTSAYESETYQNFMQNDATATASYAQADAFFSSPAFDGSYDIQNAVNSKLEELILNKADSTTAMKELVDAVNGAL
nr:ABC transporter substrate-binding protein [uncultured Gemmiger sp.]